MSITSRNTKSITIKEAFQTFLKEYNLKSKFNEAYLVVYWEKIMGDAIARRTQKITIKNGILYLTVNSSSLAQELVLAKTKLMAMLNKEIGEEIVKDVIIR